MIQKYESFKMTQLLKCLILKNNLNMILLILIHMVLWYHFYIQLLELLKMVVYYVLHVLIVEFYKVVIIINVFIYIELLEVIVKLQERLVLELC